MEQTEKQRTIQQNRALHKYFEILANTLNSAGLDMKKTLKPEIDIPWSKETIKEYIWKPIQKAQLNKGSTTELTTTEMDKVFDTINRFLAEKFGITETFPSIENIMTKLREEEDANNLYKVKKE